MRVVEKVSAHGHGSIRATHRSTFEITMDVQVTQRGECIVAVAADSGVSGLSEELKEILRKANSKLTIVLQAGQESEVVEASGSPELTFGHPRDVVVRRSSFVCNRTLAVRANKAAKDFSRALVKQLADPQQRIDITLIAEESGTAAIQE